MTTFAISSASKSDALNLKLKELYGEENFFEVDDHLRIIISEKDVTAQDVYTKIVDSNEEERGSYGLYVVFSVSSYFGYHNKKVWNWLKAKGA